MKPIRRMLAAASVLMLALSLPAFGEELAIGARGPDFTLKGTDGAMHSLKEIAGSKGTALIFTCNECPYSRGYEDRLIALAKEYEARGIRFVAINPNDPKIVPGDGFEFMVKRAKEKGFPFPYLLDETQSAAAAYGAKVTPHIFLLDAKGTLVYRGRVDDNLDLRKVSRHDFKAALDAVAGGQAVPVTETKAFGCSVKWSKTSA